MSNLQTVIEDDGMKMLRVYRAGQLILCLPEVNRIATLENQINTETFDTIEEVVAFIGSREQCCSRSYSLHLILRAYEFVNEHYIKLYYYIHSSGC
ncbi:hypothetical protein PUW24_00785 (plasmid) [Paenibacillus urinalis]|uniref:Uncharacterized protein n=1 Tax=Paenibacillus urinalis TaxID=521520 RepID=A0AAX3N702_9BACL|nr:MULTISPECIES: hypothetical protein [Paenibacillus]MCM3130550.1 hypothetical protein [Paenibacillus sp. MER 78]WDH85437.1 hypothetical protein PUW23_25715 [Paenibacillus urinalis]WDH95126.1 hypothetical protein PUW24_00785 [Paenibacillus urinalis]WDI05402.1 hypothetical protein PUW25_26785 [Paenibacillus urinalis]